MLAALRKLFNWCVARDIVAMSPCAGVDKPAPETKRERVLLADEVRKIWLAAEAHGQPFGWITQLLLLTGQRRAEVGGMRRSEIDGDLWSLPSARTKNKRPHVVPLSGAALAVIAKVPCIAGRDLLFTGNGRTPVSGWSKAKRALDAASGVKGWRLHDARRTVASIWLTHWASRRISLRPALIIRAAPGRRGGYLRIERSTLPRGASRSLVGVSMLRRSSAASRRRWSSSGNHAMSKPEREFFHGAVGYTVVRRGKLKPSAIPASARETYLENVDKVVRDVLARLDTGDRSDLADHWRMALGILEDCCATMYVIPPPSLIELIRCLHPVKRSRTAVRNEKMFDKAVEISSKPRCVHHGHSQKGWGCKPAHGQTHGRPSGIR